LSRPSSDTGDQDPVLASLYDTPVQVQRPFRQSVPFVFASPHAGRLYPESFVASSGLSSVGLRRSEDAFVDELFASAVSLGAPMITARFPRAFVDVNRSESELDGAMFDGPLPMVVDIYSPRVEAGLGVIPRIVRDGAEIYRSKLCPSTAEQRLARLYRPYHAALSRLIEETRRRFGFAVLVDCHSMPSANALPDIILGDRYGLSASHYVTQAAQDAFEARGFRVGRNVPYAGGYTTALYGNPGEDVHALQIEITRSLYMDEERVTRTARFEMVHARISAALEDMLSLPADLLIRRPDAAE
jgi:N-formylglutamate amidohydrolase